ncbi:Putative Cytidine deaminase [Rhizopus microsporus]|nr:Putative Cytidine deaminase [Rhizopus microsporus]
MEQFLQAAMLRMLPMVRRFVQKEQLLSKQCEGHHKFTALAVSTDQEEFVSPCGICRQFISEFVTASTPVYFLNVKGDHREYTFGQLLPFSFGLEQGERYLQ